MALTSAALNYIFVYIKILSVVHESRFLLRAPYFYILLQTFPETALTFTVSASIMEKPFN